MATQGKVSPGIKHYVDAASRALKKQAEYIRSLRKCRFDTIAVHGLYSMEEAIDFNQGSIIEPVYLSTSQAYRDADEMEAGLGYLIPTWCYSRIANPSIYYYEGVVALMEGYGFKGDVSCCATASGMAALRSATDPFLDDKLSPGKPKNFVSTCQIYGGTFQQFSVRKPEHGAECRFVVDSNDLDAWESKIDKNTRFLYGEAPSNPSQSFFDIAKVAELAHRHGIPFIFDNTVATPALLRPLEHGVDIVVQSTTKSLITSGFAIGGAVIARKGIRAKYATDDMRRDFGSYIKLLPNRDNGPNFSPMSAILAINDMRTLRMRMDHVSQSTLKISEFLAGHPRVEKVDYLGLKENPLHRIAKRYLFLVDSEFDAAYGKPVNRYGHLMSFRVKGGARAARQAFDALQRIYRATDLGRIKSVATIPAISTHSQQGEAARKMADIPPSLIRLCVGAEHPDDIIADLDQSLSKVGGRVSRQVPMEFSFGGASSPIVRK